MKCDSCGAPIENGKCTYCGKMFSEEQIKTTDSLHKYTRPRPQTPPKKKLDSRYVAAIVIFLVFCALLSVFTGGNDGDLDTFESEAITSVEIETSSIWSSNYTDIENFDYYIDGTNLYLKDYNGTDKRIRIASTYDIEGTKYNVVALKDGTFALHSVDSVIIPEGVISVENNTFNSCGIEYVYLPSTLEEISSSFLRYFHNVEKIYYGGTEEQWDSLVTMEREDIDAKQIVYEANSYDLQ